MTGLAQDGLVLLYEGEPLYATVEHAKTFEADVLDFVGTRFPVRQFQVLGVFPKVVKIDVIIKEIENAVWHYK